MNRGGGCYLNGLGQMLLRISQRSPHALQGMDQFVVVLESVFRRFVHHAQDKLFDHQRNVNGKRSWICLVDLLQDGEE